MHKVHSAVEWQVVAREKPLEKAASLEPSHYSHASVYLELILKALVN